MENLWPYLEVLAPSVGVGLIFWFAMRSIFRADRNERAAEFRIRQQHSEAAAQSSGSADAPQEADGEPAAHSGSQPPKD